MAKHVVNVVFEIDSKTGQVAITRRRQIATKKIPNQTHVVIDRYHMGFLLPQGRTPQENTETLHTILVNQLGMGVPEIGGVAE